MKIKTKRAAIAILSLIAIQSCGWRGDEVTSAVEFCKNRGGLKYLHYDGTTVVCGDESSIDSSNIKPNNENEN